MTTGVSRVKRFAVTIDGIDHSFADPLLKGRDLLEAAGRYPVDEHLLFFRQPDGMLEDINLSEDISLRADGAEEFTTARADRLFFVIVDGRRYPYGNETITGADLRALARIADDRDVFYDPKGGKDDLVEADETISLKGAETERFYTTERSQEPRLVTVELNGVKVKIRTGDYTTETLKEALAVAADLDLDWVDKAGSFHTLAPGETIHVVAKAKFVSHVRQGGSS